MGAMFLYKSDADIDVDAAKQEFVKKGFEKEQIFSFGQWNLLLYKKHIEQKLAFFEKNGYFICLIGAVMYKYAEKNSVLENVLNDFIEDKLELSEFRGHFNIIICHDDKITVISDSLISKKIFCDKLHTMYSSSMLAVMAAYKGKLTVNKMAVYEKMMTGIVISPDTYFNEIKALNLAEMRTAEKVNNSFTFILPKKTITDDIKYEKDFDSCINQQLDEIDGYFERLLKYSEGLKIDTGLSGGYDSRLIYSMLVKHAAEQAHTHTHDTKNIHGREKKIAIQLSEKSGNTCHTVPTSTLDKTIDLKNLMRENLHYFDGRSSFVIGGFNETYTAGYRVSATEKSEVTLSGMGGEVYRNYYHITDKKIPFKRFMKKSIIIPEFKKSLKEPLIYKKTLQYTLKKSEDILETNLENAAGIIYTRRYYSEIMMPEGQGTVIDAYNQVSDFFVPFMEDTVLSSAYRNSKLLRSNGQFEAEMINKTNPILAGVPSTYGHGFDKIPLSYILKQNIRFMVNSKIWSALAALLKGNKKQEDVLKGTLEKNIEFSEGYRLFKKIFREIDFDILMNGRYEFKNISMVVFLFYIFRDKIEFNENIKRKM